MTIACLCALFKAYCGAWEAIRDRLRRPYYLSRVDRVRKIRDKKQRTDIGKYSLQIRPLKTGTNYLQKRYELSLVNRKVFRKKVRRAVINGVK